MTWTYSGNPADSDRDEIRFLIGDTDTNDQQVSDEEIAWALTKSDGNYGAAALLCSNLASKYARLSDKEVGDLKLAYSQISQRYSELAVDLQSGIVSGVSVGSPYVGGVSAADKLARTSNEDRIQGRFYSNQFDNEGFTYGNF